MEKLSRFLLGFLLLVFTTLSFAADINQGGFGIESTRVIVDGHGGGHMTVHNHSADRVFLITVSILKELESTHFVRDFIVSPMVFRLNAGGRNTVRMKIINKDSLPKDRESLFYIKTMAIPSTKASDNSNKLVVGAVMEIGMVINEKLIYRPEALSQPSADVWDSLQFSLNKKGVVVKNPTAYYINLRAISFDKQNEIFTKSAPSEIAPFSQVVYPYIKGNTHPKTVNWVVLNDFGGDESFHAAIK